MAFPEAVKGELGAALSVAQFGGKHPAAKPWKGAGPGVLEVVDDFFGDTYRAVYTVRFSEAVYVLHAFQQKSPKGIMRGATTRSVMAVRKNHRGSEVSPSSGNVFADLGFRDAAERQTKVRLALAINRIVSERRLSQAEAAQVLAIG